MVLDTRFRLLMWLAARSGQSFKPNVGVAAFRSAFLQYNLRFGIKGPRTQIETRDLTIPTSDGSTIGARLYRRRDTDDRALPALLYFHGGGWVIGDVSAYDGLARFLAHEGRFAVLSVDYRLAPEHEFPRGHEDAFDAYSWLHEHAIKLGVDAARIAVGGDSAGGGLAAAIASYARARDLVRPAYALLMYPSVDATARFPSRRQYTENLPLTPASIEWFNRYAAPDPASRKHPLFVPLDAPDPAGHPPTYVLAAQYDPLVDEGRAYFDRLRDVGVLAVYDLRPTLAHGFVNVAGIIPEARRALSAAVEATAVGLGALPAKVAAVTGAASGIGRALALELAARNYRLALADRDPRGLEETAGMVHERTSVSTHVVDVSRQALVEAFAAAVLAEHGRIDLLINNAGVALAGSVTELSVQEIEWLMNINFWGTVYGVKAFLPALQLAPNPTIVNVSSVFGIIAPPGQSAYSASKFAVRAFSESLREELRGKVHVVTAFPAGVKTNIARSARIAAAADQESQRRSAAAFEKRSLTLPPQRAAKLIMRAVSDKRDHVLIGTDALRIEAMSRLLGPGAARLIARAANRVGIEASPRQ